MTRELIIVGGGPAACAAAINAAAEGFQVLLVADKIGGRAETSHAIENLLGFPKVSGRELAGMMHAQLHRFGVEHLEDRVVKLTPALQVQTLKGLTAVATQGVILGLGMKAKELDIPGMDAWGVFNCAEPQEVVKWAGAKVVVLGGENSATQAALHFAESGASVTMVIPDGQWRMSDYLKPVVKEHPEIDVVEGVPLRILTVDYKVVGVEVQRPGVVGVDIFAAEAMVVFNGASPATEWLPSCIKKDAKGFIKTDEGFETSIPRVWAIGDARHGSVKRIGAALGEGTSVVRFLQVKGKGTLGLAPTSK